MKLLLDTNIILDVFFYRAPWLVEAKQIWRANDEGKFTAYLTATTITDIFYIIRRQENLEKAYKAIDICLNAFSICPVTRQSLIFARTFPSQDFEDNLQIACATLAGIDHIVTRNIKDFTNSPIPVFTPKEVIKQLAL